MFYLSLEILVCAFISVQIINSVGIISLCGITMCLIKLGFNHSSFQTYLLFHQSAQFQDLTTTTATTDTMWISNSFIMLRKFTCTVVYTTLTCQLNRLVSRLQGNYMYGMCGKMYEINSSRIIFFILHVFSCLFSFYLLFLFIFMLCHGCSCTIFIFISFCIAMFFTHC